MRAKEHGGTRRAAKPRPRRCNAGRRTGCMLLSLVLALSQLLSLAFPYLATAAGTGERLTLSSAAPIFDGSNTHEFWLSNGSLAWCGDVNIGHPNVGGGGTVMEGSQATYHVERGGATANYTAAQLRAIDYLVYTGNTQIASTIATNPTAFGMYGRWNTGCMKATAVVQAALWMVRFYPGVPDVTVDGNWQFYAGEGSGQTSDVFSQDCIMRAYLEAKAYADAGGGNPAIDGCAHVIKWDTGGQDIFFFAPPVAYVNLRKESSNASVAGNGAYCLKGAEYGVYADASCTSLVGTLVTGDDGNTNTLQVNPGTYYAKETKASAGYELCGDVHSVTVGSGATATFRCAERPAPGRLNLKKVSSSQVSGNANYSLAGATYDVFSDAACKNKVGNLVTDKSGNSNELEVLAGTYYAKETKASAGHDLCAETHKVSVAPGATATFNCTEKAKTAPMTLQKVSKDTQIQHGNPNYSLAGAKYEVFSDAACTKLVTTLTTDDDGNTNTVQMLAGTYYVKEKTPSAGHELCQEVHSVTVRFGEKAKVTCEEPVVHSWLKLKKVSKDVQIDRSNANYSLAEAEYGVFSDKACEKRVATLTTNENGESNTVELLAETYYVKETKASLGHELCDEVHQVTCKLNQTTTVECAEPVRYAWAKLQKASTNEALTAGNACYSLAGAVYDVFEDENCTAKVGSLTTGEDGASNTLQLLAGTYYAKETKASPGYLLCDEVHKLTVACGETGTFQCGEKPAADPVGLALEKYDAELGYDAENNTAIGNASLADAEFTIEYYDTLDYGSYDALANSGLAPKRTWVLKTDADGASYLDDAHVVTGDALYLGLDGLPCLPRGSVVVRETKAPCGYNISTEASFQKIQETPAKDIVTYNSPTFAEQAYRGDIEFTKRADNGSDRLANVPFKLTSTTTGESHVIVTDENGFFSSAADWNSHIANTNGNDWALGETGTIDSSRLDATAGTWFGLGTAPSDSLAALPYDTYELEELRCTANEGYVLVATQVTVTRDNKTLDLGTLDDPEAEIHTVAADAADGDKYLPCGDAVVKDTVSFSHVVKGREYTLQAKLADAQTGEILTDAAGNPVIAEKTFMAEASHGTVTMELGVSTYAFVGKTLVVYETLLDANGAVLATHADKDDANQQVHVIQPQISTSAQDGADGDKSVVSDPDATVTDAVRYSGLAANTSYTVTGVLMRKTTDTQGNAATEQFLVDGKPVIASSDFTANSESGETLVTFTFDASALEEGDELVVFEELSHEGATLATHADACDEGQTVRILRPQIGTSARDAADGDGDLVAEGDVSIVDTVRYENLTPGKTYKLTGTLMEKTTDANGNAGANEYLVDGEKVTSQTEFVASAANGQAQVVFTFDASSLAKRSQAQLVVFESLSRNGVELAAHADIADQNQTVRVTPPAIQTTATDSADGDKNVVAEPQARVTDTVRYSNVNIGKTYRVFGTLMEKVTDEGGNVTAKEFLVDGTPVTAQAEFLAEAKAGEVELTFEFDATALGTRDKTQLVAFESLSYNDVQIAVHADIEDEGQTVTVTPPSMATTATDAVDEDKNVVAEAEASITDTVHYKNLTPGKTYRVSGTLMEKTVDENGATVANELLVDGQKVMAQAEFCAQAAEGDVDVTFTFDASALAKRESTELVAFESLSYMGTEICVHADIDDAEQTVKVTPPVIGTTATDAADGDKQLTSEADVSIVDTVHYSNVTPGKTYTVSGTLMQKVTDDDGNVTTTAFLNNGEAIVAVAEFCAETAEGDVQVTFEFDASSLATNEKSELVVFETLSYKDAELSSHADVNDEGQTVTVVAPTVATTATDALDDDKVIVADTKATVIDTVRYDNLTPGKTYLLEGTLMEKATNEDGTVNANELLVDGEKVTAQAEFTPTEKSGETTVTFVFDASCIADETPLVAFEALSYKGKTIAVHADVNDEEQTVTVRTPKIGTCAFDAVDNDKDVVADTQATITDQIVYTNVIPGETYTMAGILMDAESGLPVLAGNEDGVVTNEQLVSFWHDLLAALGIEEGALPSTFDTQALKKLQETYPEVISRLVWSSKEFTAENDTYYLGMDFTFDATGIIDRSTGEAKDIVVFELLLKGSQDADGVNAEPCRVVAAELDLNNADQTVRITPSSIATCATDKSDGDHELLAAEGAVITDTVTYTGLVPGKEYTLKATLMDRETAEPLKIGEKTVTATATFTPGQTDGQTQIDLGPFDAAQLAGHTLVVFEELSRGEKTVAEHKDLADKNQSVRVVTPPSPTPATGDSTTFAAIALAALAALLSLTVSHEMRRKQS